MNLFKKTRKSKDEDDAPNPSPNHDETTFAKASRALTRRKKKEVELKPVFDLASALPDRDEFRTSLLMPNLTARFSMLREQDDPTTKIGKASDDSVILPKQKSKLDFSSNLLSDIAEVESIHSTFRPPFAHEDRKFSSSDDYASDNGSIMNRARPVETNILFGGRQKLYKITTNSSTGLAGSKHVYDGDVSTSAFQQIRLKEKEQREPDETTDRSSVPISDLGETDSLRSPLTGFNKNRGTQSSTTSGPSHRPASTAATSIMSESPKAQSHGYLAVNKTKEQDANISGESIGVAMSHSPQKVEADVGHRTAMTHARSAVKHNDNSERQILSDSSTSLPELYSPLNSSSKPVNAIQKDIARPLASPSRFQTTSPTSQFYPDQDDPLASNVRPNDRGKATAMGLFNKPARHYDEVQFSQRQVQLHQGRISPPTTRSRSASRASPDSSRPRLDSQSSTTSLPKHNPQPAQVPPVPGTPVAPTLIEQSLVDPNASRAVTRPRAKSSASNKEASVKAKLELLIKKQNEELAAMEAFHIRQVKEEDTDALSSATRINAGKETFFDNDDDSSEDEVHQSRVSSKRSSRPSARSTHLHNPPAPSEIHPAFRQGVQDFNFETETEQVTHLRNSGVSSTTKAHQSVDKSAQSKHASATSLGKLDSPTVPTAGLGLSGLIRTHLRQESTNSSMLAPPSPALPTDQSRTSMASTAKTATESVKSDPFDLEKDRLTVQRSPQLPEAPPTPTTAMSQQAQHILGIATAIREANANVEKTPKVGAPCDDTNINHHGEGENDASTHHRNESTETEREQQRFEEELAARRQRVDEKLQNIQERSRSRSPHAERNGSNAAHGFSLPRFPLRSNTADRADVQNGSKAMKMLGTQSVPREQPSPHMLAQPLTQGHGQSRSSPRPPTAQEYERPSGRRTPTSRPPHRYENSHERPMPPRSTTPSGWPGTCNRSASAMDRSASRNGYLTDFDPVVMPGAFPRSPIVKRSPPRDHDYRPDSPANMRPYERSASRNAGHYPGHEGHSNMKGLSPPHLNRNLTPRPSPRPSPNPTYDASNQHQMMRPMSPPSSAFPSPNPTAIAYSNGRTTPTANSGRTTPSGTRKKSVTKGMISDPRFVSSTSSVPLVYLPRDGGPTADPVYAPPIPAMNPRRRGNTADEQSSPNFGPHPAVRPYVTNIPLDSEPSASPNFESNSSQVAVQPLRQRNRLRKSSSEGGNMAARARQQALMAEMAREKDRSPNVAVFPNRSATSLARPQDGGMF